MTVRAATARIVVVDDDPAVRCARSRPCCEADGYRVEGAHDQHEALRAVLDEPPALVVLDVTMPGLDGWELCEILRRQSQTRDVPVLFLTGRTDVRDRITAMQVGGSDFVSKPFRSRRPAGQGATRWVAQAAMGR